VRPSKKAATIESGCQGIFDTLRGVEERLGN
jgi:hypothetical protein